MKRETTHRLAGFFTAFCATLVLMGVALSLVYLVREAQADRGGEELPAPNAYLPREEDRLNILVAGREDPNTPPDVFFLIGFLPDQGKVAVCLLPPGALVETQGQRSTLASLYEKGGVRYVQKILAEYLGVPLDRYAQGELEDLDRMLAFHGLMDYYLPVDVHYLLRGREVKMPKGDYQLDGRKAADLLNCNSYAGGELERSDRGGMLISQLIQENLPAFLTDLGDQLASKVLTWLETDVSYADYEQRREALEFLAALKLPAATTVFLEGVAGEDGTLTLSPSCLDRLRSTYGTPQPEGSPEEPGQGVPLETGRSPASQKEAGDFGKKFA